MSYITDHNAWAQRVGNEYNAYIQHVKRVESGIPLMTQSKFDKNTASNYNQCYGNLLTVDQIRSKQESDDKAARFQFRTRYQKFQKPGSYNRSSTGGQSQYGQNSNRSKQTKSYADYETYLKNPYAGPAPRYIINDNRPTSSQVSGKSQSPRRQAAQSIFAASQHNNKKSIYELVKQEIKMPDGLLYRGKYAGKTRHPGDDEKAPAQARSAIREALGQHRNSGKVQSRRSSKLEDTRSSGTPAVLTKNKLTQMKKYIPEEYFKRVGYSYQPGQPNIVTQDNLQQMVLSQKHDVVIRLEDDDHIRFNEKEDLTRPPSAQFVSRPRALHKRGDLDALSQFSKGSRVQHSRVQSAHPSRKSKSHAQDSFMRRAHQSQSNKQLSSVKTVDILKRIDEFNKIRDKGKRTLNAENENIHDEQIENDNQEDLAEAVEEDQVDVAPVPLEHNDQNGEAAAEEEGGAEQNPQSEVGTSKSMIDQLTKDLEQEKQKRVELEIEIEEIRRMSQQTPSKV